MLLICLKRFRRLLPGSGYLFCVPLLTLFLLWSTMLPVLAQDTPRPTLPKNTMLVVVDRINGQVVSQNPGLRAHAGYFADYITRELEKSRIPVVNRSLIEAAQIEQEQGLNGRTDPTFAVEIGKLVGAQYFLQCEVSIGNVGNPLRPKAKFSVKFSRKSIATLLPDIINEESRADEGGAVGREDGTDSQKWGQDDWHNSLAGRAAVKACANMVAKLRQYYPMQWAVKRVLTTQGTVIEAIVDGGTLNGLKDGMALVVIRELDIDGFKETTLIGDAQIVQAQAEASKVRIVLTDAKYKIEEGDVLREPTPSAPTAPKPK